MRAVPFIFVFMLTTAAASWSVPDAMALDRQSAVDLVQAYCKGNFTIDGGEQTWTSDVESCTLVVTSVVDGRESVQRIPLSEMNPVLSMKGGYDRFVTIEARSGRPVVTTEQGRETASRDKARVAVQDEYNRPKAIQALSELITMCGGRSPDPLERDKAVLDIGKGVEIKAKGQIRSNVMIYNGRP